MRFANSLAVCFAVEAVAGLTTACSAVAGSTAACSAVAGSVAAGSTGRR